MCACRLLLLAALPALVGVGMGEVLEGWTDAESFGLQNSGPQFAAARTSVRARVGHAAVLDCRVNDVGDRSVSWVRSRDLHILSHAGMVFTADARVTVSVTHKRDDATHDVIYGSSTVTHALRIEALRPSDAGRYECQLNTEPKMSQFYNLTVVEDTPMSLIVTPVGPTIVHASSGGAATLACSARIEPPIRSPPSLGIIWMRGGQPLAPQSGVGGVSLDTERWAGRAASRLTLGGVAPGDAGLYHCRAMVQEDDGEVTDLAFRLYVDENNEAGSMEAMQRDQSAPAHALGSASAARSAYVIMLTLAFTFIMLL